MTCTTIYSTAIRPPHPACIYIWPVQRGARPALSFCGLCPLRKSPRSQSNPTPWSLRSACGSLVAGRACALWVRLAASLPSGLASRSKSPQCTADLDHTAHYCHPLLESCLLWGFSAVTISSASLTSPALATSHNEPLASGLQRASQALVLCTSKYQSTSASNRRTTGAHTRAARWVQLQLQPGSWALVFHHPPSTLCSSPFLERHSCYCCPKSTAALGW
jgi:hypothetical protein